MSRMRNYWGFTYIHASSCMLYAVCCIPYTVYRTMYTYRRKSHRDRYCRTDIDPPSGGSRWPTDHPASGMDIFWKHVIYNNNHNNHNHHQNQDYLWTTLESDRPHEKSDGFAPVDFKHSRPVLMLVARALHYTTLRYTTLQNKTGLGG